MMPQLVPGTTNLECQPQAPPPPPVTWFTESQVFGAEADVVEVDGNSAYTGAVDEVWDDGPTSSGTIVCNSLSCMSCHYLRKTVNHACYIHFTALIEKQEGLLLDVVMKRFDIDQPYDVLGLPIF
jgi:hypothetical protein